MFFSLRAMRGMPSSSRLLAALKRGQSTRPAF
jgi:hypothetical protein